MKQWLDRQAIRRVAEYKEHLIVTGVDSGGFGSVVMTNASTHVHKYTTKIYYKPHDAIREAKEWIDKDDLKIKVNRSTKSDEVA